MDKVGSNCRAECGYGTRHRRGVDRGPVITAQTAVQMAEGVARLMNADVAVATTGVGGPGPHENQPQGTVFLAVAIPGQTVVHEYHFAGDPPAVVKQSTQQALCDLLAAVANLCDDASDR